MLKYCILIFTVALFVNLIVGFVIYLIAHLLFIFDYYCNINCQYCYVSYFYEFLCQNADGKGVMFWRLFVNYYVSYFFLLLQFNHKKRQLSDVNVVRGMDKARAFHF